MGLFGGKQPAVVKSDPVAENDRIAAEAAATANAESAIKRKNRKRSALDSTVTALGSADALDTPAKTTLGA
ncbi:MAG: hypothetical protein JWQ89_2526 [Devosia sp.]|uniref:hypothetical protein n=1 Tax=Devosia sp. TaxID=1871048 RepID=UPI00262245DF|nr:hypothetical protein [Devosia sp.]MDB5540799.1 hypothetical protein [Devosia sp.]